MESKVEAPHYFLFDGEYKCNFPSFYQTAGFEWVKMLEDNWHVVRDEMLQHLIPESIPIPNYNPNLVADARLWRNICFYNYMWKKPAACKRYPKTYALLQRIPNLSYAALNMLEPNSEIYPHQGDTNITARCHLGLLIPAGLPDCGMKVNGTETGWEEGKIFAFSDAHWHSAWNHTSQHRYVFVIDVVLDTYANQRQVYCSKILSALTLKAISYKIRIPVLHILPVSVARFLHFSISSLWLMYLRIQDKYL